jgi:glutathione peroxidase-family protein
MAAFHDLTMESITGERVPFSRYEGHAVLVVNVASK